jgi:2-polyprenyl-3-methyl-5-hydroxy-6-metoxy-1,4-benzoquinol methylase/FMN phosphatase YigB (HAD superfamily)
VVKDLQVTGGESEQLPPQNGNEAKVPRTQIELPNTGERFLPEISTPNVEWCATGYEHVHRYLLAARFSADRRILDIACGEGFGSAILARSARTVKGLDLDPRAIEHAQSRYSATNLEFEVADAERLVLQPASYDVVVSFETIEHIVAQESFLDAVKGALTPEGVLIISTPNPVVYSNESGYHNPFHKRELSYEEFLKMTQNRFKHVRLYGQQVFAGSLIAPDEAGAAMRLEAQTRIETVSFDSDTLAYREPSGKAPKPRYYIAVCSDIEALVLPADMMLDSENALVLEAIRDLERIAERDRGLEHITATLEARNFQLQRTQKVMDASLKAARAELALRDATLRHAQDALAASQQDLNDRSLRYLSEIQRAHTELQEATGNAVRYRDEAHRLRSDLSFAHSTKAWRLAHEYWQAREQGIPAVVRLGITTGLTTGRILARAAYRRTIVVPRDRKRDYHLVQGSGLFDEAWYRSNYGDVPSKADALDDYLRRALDGRSPGPLFDGGYYLRVHPDVVSQRVNPLAHYVRYGAREGYETRSVGGAQGEGESIPLHLTGAPVAPRSVAVVVHSFVPRVFDEICAHLNNIPCPFTLYVSVPTEEKRHEVVASIKKHDIKATIDVRLCQNRGRHYGPFLSEFSQAVLQHDVILHVHTKTSNHLDNGQADIWRRHMLRALIANKQVVRSTLEIFAKRPEIGVIYPRTVPFLSYWGHTWLSNEPYGASLFARLGIKEYPTEGLFDFPVGGMWWAKVDALRPLFEAGFTYEDFPPEEGQLDGTLQHAIERCIVQVAKARGFSYIEMDYERGVMRENEGSKNLDEYVHHSQSELLHSIRDVDLVSFDIFDTLLLRPSRTSEAVMRYIGCTLQKQYPKATDFFEMRLAAEVSACKEKGPLLDVNIDEIYACFPRSDSWSEEAIAAARNLELETEQRIVEPRECAVQAARFARGIGKRVIVVSDTHLPRPVVERLLESAGLAGCFDEMYLSSEQQVRKDSGELWRLALEREKVSPRRWLHIGDNEHTDLAKACDRGLRVFHLMRPAELVKLRGFEPPFRRQSQLWANDLMMGPVINRIAGDPLLAGKPLRPVELATPEDVGYTTFGPLVFAFIRWLIRHPALRNTRKLYFLSREGFVLQQVYDAVRNQLDDDTLPESVYLLASEKVLRSAAQGIAFSPELILMDSDGFQGSLAELLRAQLGMDMPVGAPADLLRVRLPEDTAMAVAGLGILQDQVVAKGVAHLEIYRAYAKSVGLLDDTAAILVGASSHETMQELLRICLGQEFTGLYMGAFAASRDGVRSERKWSACFVEDAPRDFVEAPALKYRQLIAGALSAPHGQLEGLNDRSAEIDLLFEDETRTDTDLDIVSKLQGGILQYCGDLLRYYGSSLLDAPIDTREGQDPLRILGEGGSRAPECVMRILTQQRSLQNNSEFASLIARRDRGGRLSRGSHAGGEELRQETFAEWRARRRLTIPITRPRLDGKQDHVTSAHGGTSGNASQDLAD